MPQTAQNKLILVLIIILGFAAGYLYYSQLVAPAQTPAGPAVVSKGSDLKVFENLTINFSILDNAQYKSLEIFGESPVNPGVTGKKDIFAPI